MLPLHGLYACGGSVLRKEVLSLLYLLFSSINFLRLMPAQVMVSQCSPIFHSGGFPLASLALLGQPSGGNLLFDFLIVAGKKTEAKGLRQSVSLVWETFGFTSLSPLLGWILDAKLFWPSTAPCFGRFLSTVAAVGSNCETHFTALFLVLLSSVRSGPVQLCGQPSSFTFSMLTFLAFPEVLRGKIVTLSLDPAENDTLASQNLFGS